jgi:hypothetical protein
LPAQHRLCSEEFDQEDGPEWKPWFEKCQASHEVRAVERQLDADGPAVGVTCHMRARDAEVHQKSAGIVRLFFDRKGRNRARTITLSAALIRDHTMARGNW